MNRTGQGVKSDLILKKQFAHHGHEQNPFIHSIIHLYAFGDLIGSSSTIVVEYSISDKPLLPFLF